MLPSRGNKAKQSNLKIKQDNLTESQEDILISMHEAMNRRSSMKYTFAAVGKCCVEEELINHLIISLYT